MRTVWVFEHRDNYYAQFELVSLHETEEGANLAVEALRQEKTNWYLGMCEGMEEGNPNRTYWEDQAKLKGHGFSVHEMEVLP